MQISVSPAEKMFSVHRFRPIFAAVLVLLFVGFLYFATGFFFAKSVLEELIDDDVVWQEVKNLPIDETLLPKMLAEIEGIKAKERSGEKCEQYAVRTRRAGYFNSPTYGVVWLNENEIWKIGKTCLREQKRYPLGLGDERLIFEKQFVGNEMQCLVVEKVKLYAYALSAENMKREKKFSLPPGNKIYR